MGKLILYNFDVAPLMTKIILFFSVRTNEMYTRMEFLVFVLGVFTLVVCVFQPKLSQRDLDSLSYIGLL